jgi:CRISPR-associated helicase Cas3/CRISPR-associated endonuclease Cas3-HD
LACHRDGGDLPRVNQFQVEGQRVKYYAHTAVGKNGTPLPECSGQWQPLATHLSNVAQLAGQFAAPFNLTNLTEEAKLAGLLHDLGKYAERFQARLKNPTIHGINHWAAGAVHAAQNLKAFAVAFAADGHHTGIPALHENDAGVSLQTTVRKFADNNRRLELTGQCPESLGQLIARFSQDGLELPSFSPSKIQDKFAEAFRSRMLFSCLVDADFLDTENHFSPELGRQRIAPDLQPDRALEILKKHLAAKSSAGPVNALRKQLLNDCFGAAQKPPGLFTLTAPTGSGKTLSSLAFALQHIIHHNAKFALDDSRRFRRIIVVIPYTSIIEQTARVYREELFESAFGGDYVLEHHSAVAPRERNEDRGRDAEEDRLRRAQLATENWASPLVVTTNVQFFESLFSNRPSDCRKLHNIGRSVVLFDEVQTLPPRLVPSLLSGVRLLTLDYGVTAVFMTATQPAFASAGEALPYDWKPEPISSNEAGLAEALRRTKIELPQPGKSLSWADVAAKVAAEPQSLCVVNTTKDARELFRLVRGIQPDGVFHLSARMCPAHRQEKLAEIRRRLKAESNELCRLVSTQLIEAGVDVDFPIAYRALGPLDSIIQTAGRCNREGRHAEPRPVIIFRPAEDGHLPKSYEQVMKITESFLARQSEAQSRIHQPSFYAEYFAELYKLVGRDSADADPVFAASKAFNFPKAADECQLVGNETQAVLVKKWMDKDGRNRGNELVEKLAREKHLTATECREAQRYSVNLYQGEFFDAQAKDYIYQPAKDWNFWVWNSEYDENFGLGHLDDFVC